MKLIKINQIEIKFKINQKQYTYMILVCVYLYTKSTYLYTEVPPAVNNIKHINNIHN